mgnify:CR=1 FL=1
MGEGFVFGFGVGMQDGKSEGSDGSNIGYTGRSVTSYLMGRGDVFFGSFTVTAGTQDFDTIQSAGAYGSTPSGATAGQRSTPVDQLSRGDAPRMMSCTGISRRRRAAPRA